MDEKLAHGITRNQLRQAWQQSLVSADANSVIITPFVRKLRQRGKLSREDAKALDRAYDKAGAGAATFIWRKRFLKPGLSPLSPNYVMFTAEMILSPARIAEGQFLGNMMLEL